MAAWTTVSTPAGPSPKAEQTRRAIVDAAMRLFRANGYDQTTMRAIAAEAGVSLGSAYYYFAGKENLIQGFYDQVGAAHLIAAREQMADRADFASRLSTTMLAWLDVAEPYHEFAGQFFRNAADPSSPLSPFSADSAAPRDAAIALYREVADGSDLKVAKSLREELPELLWLLQMGMVLHWVHDTSEGQARTRQLVAAVVPLIDRMVRMSRAPLVRGVVQDLLAVIELMRPDPD